MNDLLNDTNFDFFRAVLIEEDQIEDIDKDKNYFNFLHNDAFLEFTQFDI